MKFRKRLGGIWREKNSNESFTYSAQAGLLDDFVMVMSMGLEAYSTMDGKPAMLNQTGDLI